MGDVEREGGEPSQKSSQNREGDIDLDLDESIADATKHPSAISGVWEIINQSGYIVSIPALALREKIAEEMKDKMPLPNYGR